MTLAGARALAVGRFRGSGFWLALVVVLGIVIASESRFMVYNFTIVALFAIVVVGLNALVGYAGQISFAPTAFMAIGGYAIAVLTTRHAIDPSIGIVVGMVIAAVVALVVGLPILRLRGHYLAMATFALALATTALANSATELTGGPIGIAGIPRPAVGPISLDDPVIAMVVSWVLLGVSLLAVEALGDSRVGRAWRAIAGRPEVAESLGVPPRHYKLLAFVASAVLAALSGSLYVAFTTFIAPDLYDNSVLLKLFAMLFVGGVGVARGPVIGALIVVLVPTVMGDLQSYQSLAFALVLLAILILRPAGLGGHMELPFKALRARGRDARPAGGPG